MVAGVDPGALSTPARMLLCQVRADSHLAGNPPGPCSLGQPRLGPEGEDGEPPPAPGQLRADGWKQQGQVLGWGWSARPWGGDGAGAGVGGGGGAAGAGAGVVCPAVGWGCLIVYQPDLESASLVTRPKAGRLGLRVAPYR